MRVNKLNNVDISTYGLTLKSYFGHLNLSARKKTTEIWNHTANDKFYEDRKITFILHGKFNSASELGTAIEAFNENLENSPEGTFSTDYPGNDIQFPTETYIGRFVNGSSVRIFAGNYVQITLVMTWQGLQI